MSVRRAEPSPFAADFQAIFSRQLRFPWAISGSRQFVAIRLPARHRKDRCGGSVRGPFGRQAPSPHRLAQRRFRRRRALLGSNAAQSPARTARIAIKPIEAAVESEMGIMLPDLNRQSADFPAPDVGRIGNDDVELADEGVVPVADDKGRPGRRDRPLRRFRRCPRRAFRAVDADSRGQRKLAEKRQQDRAAAGAEVEDRQWIARSTVSFDR